MAFPTDDGQFFVDTDASYETIGAVLTQIQTGIEMVIVYGRTKAELLCNQ